MAQAAALKMQGIEINCAQGELTPGQLDRQARKHLRHFVDDLQLEVVALGGDTGFRFGDGSPVERFLDDTKPVFDLAMDLRVRTVTTAIGSVPESPENPDYGPMTEVLADIGNYAANRECCLAISAGLDKPETLAKLLDHLNNDGLRVNYDPANFKGFIGQDCDESPGR
jgi:sugar phosphate isomerase/epimerase